MVAHLSPQTSYILLHTTQHSFNSNQSLTCAATRSVSCLGPQSFCLLRRGE
uniref:Uncharacterized protein n=1 Tax=Rhizophora mucronata TaxID=61149 RepID=A0A2P2PLA8_RHIMU